MKGGVTAQSVNKAMESADFRRRFLWLILITWNVPPIFGLGFILLIGVLTPQQLQGILTTPLEPAYIIAWSVFAFWFFPRKVKVLTLWLDNKSLVDTNEVLSAVKSFPLWYWGLFLLYLTLAPISVVVAGEIYTDFVTTPLALFRIMLVALIISIIVGLPIFFLIMDLFGRVMGGLVVEHPIVTVKTKVFLIGALIPLLIDTMLVQYYWTRTGFFTYETFGIWLVLELLAIGGSLIFVRSFGQSLSPLQSAPRYSGDLSLDDFTLLQSKSTDELGVLTSNYRNLLNSQILSNMELSKNRAEFEAMFNSISDGVIYADTQRRIILINPAITRIFGYSLPELKGNQTKVLYADPKDFEVQGKKRFGVKSEINHALYEIQYQRKDQTKFYGETYGTKVIDNDGNIIGLLGIIRDVTERKKSETRLKDSQRMLQQVLDTIPVRVFWKDRNCVYLGCNKLFAEDSGLEEPEKLVGKTDFDMGWKEQAELYQSDDRVVMQSGMAKLNYEEPQNTPDGKKIWLQTSKIPITNNAGEIVGVLGTYDDITERKQAEEDLRKSQQRLSLHFMQTPLGVIEWDMDFNVVDWNPAVANIFGYSKKEAVGRHASFIIPNAEKEHVDQVWNELVKNTGGFNSTNENLTRDGSLIHCKWYNTPLVNSDGKVIGVTSLVENITESLRAEEELTKYREQLEELVEGRTAELKAVNDELETFSYSVSHDLRAPLRAIDGFSQALLDDYKDKLDSEGRDYLQRVRGGAGRMALLIDDLLQLSRVSRSTLKRTTVNLTQVVKDISKSLAEQEPNRKVEFDIKPGLKASGDQRLLTLVMENLVGNAWKYTGKKTSATITIGKKKQDGKNVFYIKDNGAGFDMRYAKNLFGAFQRLHRDEEFEGTGVGLATVQRIIHLHGGSIWAEAEVDKGATFYFDLDSTKASAPDNTPVVNKG